MDEAIKQEARQIISQNLLNDSVPSLADASFSEREQLAELHKQIELKKQYRDSLRSLNLGLYALKQGMCRNGSDALGDQLAKDYHSSIRQALEKQWKASQGLEELCHEYTLLGNSRQALVEQAELQKLQSVLRLQEQVRVKLASTRVVKQWEREKATLLSEQKEMSKLEVVGQELMQKRKEMLERKHIEVANTLICIGEALEKAEELRTKLAEITRKHRDDLHEDQPSDADMRTEDGKKDSVAGEIDKDTNSAPMFDSIDWNLGSVNMDLRLDLNFKNPNDFPDILTHLSAINTSKYQIKKATQHFAGKGSKQYQQMLEERKKSSKQDNKQIAGKTPFPEYTNGDDTTGAKKIKMNNSTEKIIRQQVVGYNEDENAKAIVMHDKNQLQPRVLLTTLKCVPKKNNETMANPQHRVSRKKPSMSTQHEGAVNQGSKTSLTLERNGSPMAEIGQQDVKKDQQIESGSSVSRSRSPAVRAIRNNVATSSNQTKNKKESQSNTQQHQQQQQQQQRVHLGKKQTTQQKQPEQLKRTRTMKMLSPVCTNPPSKSVQNPISDNNESTPMDVELDGNQDDESTADNTSLDFAMQSGSSEFDMNFSDDLQPNSGTNQEDDLDFLSINPGRVTRSKGQKKKTNNTKSSGSGDDMDTFDFTFGESNSSESLDQPDDLF